MSLAPHESLRLQARQDEILVADGRADADSNQQQQTNVFCMQFQVNYGASFAIKKRKCADITKRILVVMIM